MLEFKLPKHFWDDNPLIEISTAQITYFQMVTVVAPGFNEEIAAMVVPGMESSRREAYELEKEQILKIDTTEDVIKYMRKIKELQNRNLIVEKALAMRNHSRIGIYDKSKRGNRVDGIGSLLEGISY